MQHPHDSGPDQPYCDGYEPIIVDYVGLVQDNNTPETRARLDEVVKDLKALVRGKTP